MTTSFSSNLTDAQRQQWDREGYLVLPNLLPRSTIEGMRRKYAEVTDQLIGQLKAEGLIVDEGKHLPFERRLAAVAGRHANKFGRSWRKLLGGQEVFDLQCSPGLVNVVGELIGGDVIGHAIYNARPKLPNQQFTVVPWHQDSGYFGAQSATSLILTCWIPLVPVHADNGCMQVIPGTHRESLHQHTLENCEGQFLELDAAVVDESRAVTLPMQPGDVLIFNNLVFHRSLPSISPEIRWSIDVRYVRDGDYAGDAIWPDADFQWVIRSDAKPVTTFARWLAQVERFAW